MVVFADMTAGSERQLGDPKLILSIDLGEEAASGASNLILATKPLVSTFTGLPPVCAVASLGRIATTPSTAALRGREEHRA